MATCRLPAGQLRGSASLPQPSSHLGLNSRIYTVHSSVNILYWIIATYDEREILASYFSVTSAICIRIRLPGSRVVPHLAHHLDRLFPRLPLTFGVIL